MTLPPDSAARKWSHERWLVAGLFGFIGAGLVAIVPGVSQSLHGPAATVAPARISLALPLPKAQELGAATRSGWQFVRVRSGEISLHVQHGAAVVVTPGLSCVRAHLFDVDHLVHLK